MTQAADTSFPHSLTDADVERSLRARERQEITNTRVRLGDEVFQALNDMAVNLEIGELHDRVLRPAYRDLSGVLANTYGRNRNYEYIHFLMVHAAFVGLLFEDVLGEVEGQEFAHAKAHTCLISALQYYISGKDYVLPANGGSWTASDPVRAFTTQNRLLAFVGAVKELFNGNAMPFVNVRNAELLACAKADVLPKHTLFPHDPEEFAHTFAQPPAKPAEPQEKPANHFIEGQAVVFAGDFYFVKIACGGSARVTNAMGQDPIDPFYWHMDGASCRPATDEELAKMAQTYCVRRARAVLRGEDLPDMAVDMPVVLALGKHFGDTENPREAIMFVQSIDSNGHAHLTNMHGRGNIAPYDPKSPNWRPATMEEVRCMPDYPCVRAAICFLAAKANR